MSEFDFNDTYYDDQETEEDNQNRSNYRYHVQVGLFRIYNNAFNLQMQLNQIGVTSDISRQGDLYAVHVGDFCNMDDAVMLEQLLRRFGYDTLLVAV